MKLKKTGNLRGINMAVRGPGHYLVLKGLENIRDGIEIVRLELYTYTIGIGGRALHPYDPAF